MSSGILWCVDYKFHIHFLSNIFVKALEPLENPEFWVDGWPLTKNFEILKKSNLIIKTCFLGKAWSKNSKNKVSDRPELRFLRYSFLYLEFCFYVFEKRVVFFAGSIIFSREVCLLPFLFLYQILRLLQHPFWSGHPVVLLTMHFPVPFHKSWKMYESTR